MERKRDVSRERRISPVNFNARHKTSTRHDDKIRATSLNQYNARQLEIMMQKAAVRKQKPSNPQMDFMFMNENETIDVIHEVQRKVSFNRKRSTDKIFE